MDRATLPRIDLDEFERMTCQLSDKLDTADVVQKDIIVSNLFLNLYFDHQKMTRYSLKEPFASLVELNAIQLGGGGWDWRSRTKIPESLLSGIKEAEERSDTIATGCLKGSRSRWFWRSIYVWWPQSD